MSSKSIGLAAFKATRRCEQCGCPLSIVTADCPHKARHTYLPTEEEIAAACAEIRAANLNKLRSQVNPAMSVREPRKVSLTSARKLSNIATY